MSTFVGRLARTFSQGPGCSETSHRRVSSTPESVDIPSPHVQDARPKLSTSPSFNDFSLRTEEDAVEELGWLGASLSLGSPSAGDSSKASGSMFSFDGADSTACGSPTTPMALLPTTATAAVAQTPSAPIPVPKSKRRTKIMGMDAYDYCDLIRSSSL